MTPPSPGRALRLALVAWGLGHLAVGRRGLGLALLAAELLAALLVAWLTIGLADTSAYLVPFVAGVVFITGWAWQAVDAYRSALALEPARRPTPERSPAAAIGWLSLPMLVWGTGFWLIGAGAATPGAVLDRFVTEWTTGELAPAWPPRVRAEAAIAESRLGGGLDRFRDLRFHVAKEADGRATAVGESIHYERRATSFLGLFDGSVLVPVADEQVITLTLEATAVELPGGGDIGAVRWDLVDADAGS